MDFLTVNNITKKHGSDFLLNDISFGQNKGQNIAIAGETGSGKTTLIKIVAGLEQADSGNVFFEGKQVKGLREKLMPGHKGIAYLSQYFELSNNYRVAELLAYANDLTDEQSAKLYEVCRIEHLLSRWSQTLSGGEKQRVALAKLLTQKPKLLLLDEPFSNLDLIHKNQLKAVVADISGQLDITCMLISHDAEDILPWADEILVMQEGRIAQQGSPEKIYNYPETDYVAGIFGKYNLLAPSTAALFGIQTGNSLYIRPEQIRIDSDAPYSNLATVTKTQYMGSHYEIYLQLQGINLLATSIGALAIGQNVIISLDYPKQAV